MTKTIKKAYSPKEVHDLWVEYGRAKDLDALLSLYEPGGSIYDVGKDELLEDDNARRRFLKEFLETVSDFHLHTASITMSGDGSLALLRSKWNAKGVTGDDAKERSEWAAQCGGAEVARKQPDGSWLLIIDNPYASTDWDGFPEY